MTETSTRERTPHEEHTMNDFLITELAREHNARLAREASVRALVRAAEGGRERPSLRRRRGLRLRPRNG